MQEITQDKYNPKINRRLVKDVRSQDCKRVDLSEGKEIKAEIKNTRESKIRQGKTSEEQDNMRVLRKAIIYLPNCREIQRAQMFVQGHERGRTRNKEQVF